MSIQVLKDRVLLRPFEPLPASDGTIILTDETQPVRGGHVVSVGPHLEHLPLRVGSQVLYGHGGTPRVDVDGEELLLTNEPNIIAYYNGDL